VVLTYEQSHRRWCSANLLLLVVTTAGVESSVSLVLESRNRAGERHRRSNDRSLHLDVCLLGIKQCLGMFSAE
jgi:hypothetical protein